MRQNFRQAVLAEYWGLAAPIPGRGDTTSLPPMPDGTVWAWGGSEASAGTVTPHHVREPIPNLLTEIDQYLANNQPDADTLFTIWSGADNLLISNKFGPKAAFAAAEAVVTAMKALEAKGARHLLVINLPNLALTPHAQSDKHAYITKAAAELYSTSYNLRLDHLVAGLKKDSAFDAEIYFINAHKALSEIVRAVHSGKSYTPDFVTPGPAVTIDNITDEALKSFEATGTLPTNYLFWDGVHPTTQGHQIIAGEILRAVK